MDIIKIKKVFIWDGINQKYRLTKFRVDNISGNEVLINGIAYSRKGSKRIGRIIETRISANDERIVGRVIPIYA